MFKRKKKQTAFQQPVVSNSEPKEHLRFDKRVLQFLKTHRKTRIVLFLLLLTVVGLALLFALYKIVLITLGTIMQFWFRYTSNEYLLWFLTLLCFGLICTFIYLLWVKREQYLKREEEEEENSRVVSVFEKQELDTDWVSSDEGWR